MSESNRIINPFLVTVSGSPGSGKSTACKKVCKRTGAERIYVGQIMRDLAQEKGMSLERYGQYIADNPHIDREVDEDVARRARELYSQKRRVIVEGRTQFHFLPKSIKIYIHVDIKEGAKRIWEDLKTNNKRNETTPQSLDEMIEKVARREENDAQRYLTAYGIDHRDPSHYNHIIDSTTLSKEKVAERLIEIIMNHNQSQ